jgi:uncharacterized protein YndB with AHSA1/START domain
VAYFITHYAVKVGALIGVVKKRGHKMPTELRSQKTIVIQAPIEEVWDALTRPELIRRWFFGVNTRTTWMEGTPIVHKGEYQGEPYEDRGEILTFTPPKLLSYSHWSSISGLPDKKENYQRVTYSLVPKGRSTELTLTEDNLPSEEGKELSDKSWDMALDMLKHLLEKQPITT